MSDDIERFVDFVFNTSPKDANSINLEIETDTPQELFEYFLQVTILVLKRWYGKSIDPSVIEEKDIQLMKQYFKSFGIKWNFESKPIDSSSVINNKSYLDEYDLKKMKFQIPAGDLIYSIWFSF
jgi:hypothetical protein